MKKFFLMLASWFVAIIVIVVGSIVYDKLQSADYDTLAVPYVKRAITEISQWDSATARALMVAEVSARISDEQFDQSMARFSRLGALQGLDEPALLKIYRDQGTIIGQQTVIEYKTEARYANDNATINLQLVDRDGYYELYRFNFSSQVLSE